ncbi:fimbrial protein [Serratia entomophila]|uniref:fimbrial protein n=1 Tax=Serratia entomophila TaxID=42906 RepID=UPI00217877AC|nr:fimbrial protein [Serratia entomophila]CAI1949796.1 Major MR/P fimbria protein precursor [Serratia entomophila]
MRLRVLAMLSCMPWWFAALPATADTELIGSPLQFHGTVVSRPCNIEPQSADQLVEMGTVIVKTLYRYGHTVPVPFNIKLTDCKTSVFKSVNVTFSGTEDPELPGKLAINNGDNGAAIALFDHQGAELDLNRASSAVALQNGPNVLNFTAYVQGHPSAIQNKTIIEGEFSSVANFVLAYQ